MQIFLLTLIKSVIIQIVGVLGIFFVLGFVHAQIQFWTHKNYNRTLGWKGILWTAWIGTPVHELGHIFFAKLFRHKIHKISIFQPDEASGNLGHVEHSYNPHSLYQKIGNFFIGSAPMIFGSIILMIFLYLFVANGKEVFLPLTEQSHSITSFIASIAESLKNLFSTQNMSSWNFWLFLYMSFCIASHMAPSKADRNGMWKGFFWMLILLVLINAIVIWLGGDITSYVLSITQYLGIFIALFLYAILLSILHLMLSLVLVIIFWK